MVGGAFFLRLTGLTPIFAVRVGNKHRWALAGWLLYGL